MPIRPAPPLPLRAAQLRATCWCWPAQWRSDSTVEATVADTAGNTWIKGAFGSKSGSVNTRTEIWYCLNAAAITSVTITTPSFAHAGNLSEWSGVASFDAGSGSTVGGTGVTITSPTITPTTGDLIIAGENHANATTSTSSYGTALTTAGSTVGGMSHPRYKLSGTTSEAGVWTIGSAVWGACIVSFKPWVVGPGAFQVNAFQYDAFQEPITVSTSGSFTANAVLKKTLSGSFVADSFLRIVITGSLTANAFLKRVRTGSFTADSIFKKTISGALYGPFTSQLGTTDSMPGNIALGFLLPKLTADAVIRKTTAGSLTANAWLRRIQASR